MIIKISARHHHHRYYHRHHKHLYESIWLVEWKSAIDTEKNNHLMVYQRCFYLYTNIRSIVFYRIHIKYAFIDDVYIYKFSFNIGHERIEESKTIETK